MTTSHNTGNAAIATTVTDHAPAIRSSSTISVGNASHGSFGLPPSQSLSAIHRRPPAVELVHCSSSSHSNSHHHRSTLSSVLRQPTSRTKMSHTNVDEGAETEDPHPHLPFNSTNGPQPPVSLKRHHSTGADTAATPSSVHLIRATSGMSSMSGNPPKPPPFALTRDLSDLSGSYYNGNSGGGRSTTLLAPSNISNTKWRHAKVLSRQRLPQHPQPYNMDDESSYGAAHSAQFRRGKVKSMVSVSNTGSPTTTSISMERGGDIIEVCLPNISFVAAHSNDPTAPSSSRHGSSSNSHKVNRIPLLLILMDPQKQLYELLQLWIDTSIDTVRDILQTINKNIADHHQHHHGSGSGYWKQDYDGLFQIRNNHFSQLIHVLPAGKYDIVPGEVWICKPWSMTSKQTVHHASTLLNHLKQLQILQYRKCSDYGPIWNQWKLFRTTNTSSSNSSHNNNNNKLDDTVLVLSKKATQRLYVPGGILKHHHACQFLSFVPPLENDDDMVVVGPKASTSTTLNNDCSLSTASGLSDSHCDDDDDDVDLLEEETDDDHEEILSSDEDKLERTAMNPSRMVPESYQDHMKHHDSSRVVPHSTFTTMTEDEQLVLATPSSSSSPLLVPTDDDVWRRNSNATVCSAKTKESTYIFRTYTYHESQDHSNGRTKSIRNTSTNRPILHAIPHSHSFGTFHDRTTTSSSSALQRVLRRFYTLFHCRQESMLNRRSRSYDEQLYYTNSSHYNNNNMSNKYAHGKQRKSSATTTRTTLLSDDASMLTTNHPLQYHHDNTMDRNQQQQWRDIDTASHCSGVPLLLTSAPTADWVTHI